MIAARRPSGRRRRFGRSFERVWNYQTKPNSAGKSGLPKNLGIEEVAALGRHPLPNGTPVASKRATAAPSGLPREVEDAGEWGAKVQKQTHFEHREKWSWALREGPQPAGFRLPKVQKQTHYFRRAIIRLTKRSQIVEENRGFRKNLGIEEVVASEQAPPPEWHTGRQKKSDAAPSGLPREVEDAGEWGAKLQKQTHFEHREKCPERCAKDLNRQDFNCQKCKSKPTISLQRSADWRNEAK
jgi:hypothetical protein